MRQSIKQLLPDHVLLSTEAPEFYIVDYKNLNKGEVKLLEVKPQDIEYITIRNSNKVEICFDGFKENALPIRRGLHNRQCECVLFPEAGNENNWVLFIEAKYANDRQKAFDENIDYPNCMVDQIISTVSYFRDKGIIAQNRRVNAIVSFPKLIREFNSTFFTGKLSIENILLTHKIRIRATNSASVISQKRIKLNAI